jgi:hypothetical protein
MSAPHEPASGPPPSVFLSYASEDRPAARRLRDALAAEGLEVWYDENELTGGEAWDRKIRRQIRECTYFMPVISAQSNARQEGYFRREWRIALERTLDMADDVIFLLPVAIDDTNESSARVPDQFLNVQWLRAPDGEATLALRDLCQRLLPGGTHRLHKPTVGPAPAVRATTKTSAKEKPGKVRHPPPRWLLPVIELWRWLPRWAKVLVLVIGIPFLLNRCSSGGERAASRKPAQVRANPSDPGTKPAGTIATPNIAAVVQQVEDALQRNGVTEGVKRRPADVTVLANYEDGAAGSVQQELFNKLVTTKGVRSRLSVMPLKGTPGDATPADRGKAEGSWLVISAVEMKNNTGANVLRVKLDRVADGTTVWTADYPTSDNAAITAVNIYSQILPFLLKKD